MADEQDKKQGSRAEAVRAAVDQAFQTGPGQARERAQELVDDLAQRAGKVRHALDDVRPATAEELRSLRKAVETLEQRVAALEAQQEHGPARRPETTRRSGPRTS